MFLLSYIESYWFENWTSPTVREIGNALGLASPATVHDYLERLVVEGHLEVRRVSARRVLYRTRRSLVREYQERSYA